jgi:GT2 family glycosyltransferase
LARRVFSRSYPSYPEEQSQQPRSVDWVFGACLLVRRKAIDLVGPLDEEYFMYTEETDWCYRMRRGGWDVYYLPDARVKHWSGQSSNTAPIRKRSQLYRSKWLFLRKRRGWLRAAAFYGMLRVASSLKLVAWALGSVSPRSARRDWARQQVQSYALLLREL